MKKQAEQLELHKMCVIQLEQSLMEEKKRNKQLVEQRDQSSIDQQREKDEKKQKEKMETFKLKNIKPNIKSTGELLPFEGTSRKETANVAENLNREERNGFNQETVEELQENSQTDGIGEEKEHQLRGPIKQKQEEQCEKPKFEENKKKCITDEEEKEDKREDYSERIELKQINENDTLNNGDEKQIKKEDEQPNEEKEEKSDTPDPNENNRNEFPTINSDEGKGLGVKIKHEIKETEHKEYQRQQANKMFSFDENGIPIWKESTVFPKDKMPECPINFDPVKWEKDCLDKYNLYKRKKFDVLFEKCTQKHEKREAKRKEKERREKEAAMQLALKMEQEGKNQIEILLEEQYKYLEIEISDMSDTDEEDEQNRPELDPKTPDQEEKGKKTKVNQGTAAPKKCKSSALPKTPHPNEVGKGSKQYEQPQRKILRSDKSVTIPKPDLSKVKKEQMDEDIPHEEEDESDVDKIHYGREISDTTSEASAVSTPSTRHSERSLTRNNSKRPRDLSASTVKVLSDPQVLHTLLDFQGPGENRRKFHANFI